MRHFVNLLVEAPVRSAAFYRDLLGLTTAFEADWFVQLTGEGVELGLLARDSEATPVAGRAAPPQGVMLTFVVDDVHAIHERAKAMGRTVVEPPTPTPYGQTRMIVTDDDGVLVDVSSLTPPSAMA